MLLQENKKKRGRPSKKNTTQNLTNSTENTIIKMKIVSAISPEIPLIMIKKTVQETRMKNGREQDEEDEMNTPKSEHKRGRGRPAKKRKVSIVKGRSSLHEKNQNIELPTVQISSLKSKENESEEIDEESWNLSDYEENVSNENKETENKEKNILPLEKKRPRGRPSKRKSSLQKENGGISKPDPENKYYYSETVENKAEERNIERNEMSYYEEKEEFEKENPLPTENKKRRGRPSKKNNKRIVDGETSLQEKKDSFQKETTKRPRGRPPKRKSVSNFKESDPNINLSKGQSSSPEPPESETAKEELDWEENIEGKELEESRNEEMKEKKKISMPKEIMKKRRGRPSKKKIVN